MAMPTTLKKLVKGGAKRRTIISTQTSYSRFMAMRNWGRASSPNCEA
jgi:hypothetical protein